MRSLRRVKNIKGKVALVRVDFNLEDIHETLRLTKTLPTLEYLKEQGATTVIISHRGKPEGRIVPQLSLKFLLPFLKEHLDGDITFIENWNVRQARAQIRMAPAGSIFLLENIRFHPGEEKNDPTFLHQLASLGDFYVNDAFASSHRAGASITGLPTHLPSCAGLLLEDEIAQLKKAMRNPKKPLVVILAGGKAKDKFAVIEKLYSQTAKFLIGGVLANTFFKAKGMRIDGSVMDATLLGEVAAFIGKKKIILPVDWVSNHQGKIYDIGPKTIQEFSRLIKGAKTVIWNGPMGFFENPRYRHGSEAIAKAVAGSKAFSIIGGGETTSLIKDMGLEKKIGFLSTGGGAMLAFLAGKKLPGIEALS